MTRVNLRKNTVFNKACATCYFRPGCPRETIRFLADGFDFSNRAPFNKSEIYAGKDLVRNPDNYVGTSLLLLTNRRVNNSE